MKSIVSMIAVLTAAILFTNAAQAGYTDGMNQYAAYHVMQGGMDPLGLKIVYEDDGTATGKRYRRIAERVVEHDSALDIYGGDGLLMQQLVYGTEHGPNLTDKQKEHMAGLEAQMLAARLTKFFKECECVTITIKGYGEGGTKKRAFGDFGAVGRASSPIGTMQTNGTGQVNIYGERLGREGVDASQTHRTVLHELLHAMYAVIAIQNVDGKFCDGEQGELDELRRYAESYVSKFKYPRDMRDDRASGGLWGTPWGQKLFEERKNAGTLPKAGDTVGIDAFSYEYWNGYDSLHVEGGSFDADIQTGRTNWVE